MDSNLNNVQWQAKGQASAVVIPGAGLNMDSITASPHMVKMASNLLLGGGSGGSVSSEMPILIFIFQALLQQQPSTDQFQPLLPSCQACQDLDLLVLPHPRQPLL